MDRLNWIQSFVRVVETGSFSAVAREYNTTQPTISKQIAALEDYLDVQLLTRSTRKLQLTLEGERFFEHCQGLLDAVEEAKASVGQRQNPVGTLRVNCPVAFGQHQIMPYLKGFLARYPNLKLDLMMSDNFVDLVEEGVDLAMRIGQVNDPALIVHPIGLTHRITIASVDYFHNRQEPKIPEELIDHNCIVYTRLVTGYEWHFQLPTGETTKVTVKGNLQVDNSTAIREAVLSGIGIAVCPVWLFGELIQSDRLKIILKDYQPTPLPIHVVYRRGRFISAKVRCFIEYFTNEFRLNPWLSGYGMKSSI
ncbi:LysR family transcriptional regulator [Aetokthonos hydrillicola Thurmond2011]|jgi:DNA-binding transcriptional LysR family regulator|uniref:LysR family transcriptional regulator n=1 Tax=Aetokthonos hydrillicola Thurmond2011 TaxID=2712845 RepID=A0AAP5ICZ7_9CYAN|nr:LysR family transcriptional regulator [Aetokthonos hydrillicola]MBO3461571.1 LysR family transcriptional regulator [Aetokthonos hydrillicola CCALA 1050]MBW4586127.1 LysR family transcriptional regulator [Aetokthonos hydrillicola CCALA 1050]MDR9897732.1 LysR family transcriptional regulator [Aetokthonos hydrillicola Thurmond2011]